MDVSESAESIVRQLRDAAGVESVFGDPVEVGDRTLIPVARVSFGFGAGFGSGPEGTASEEDNGSGEGGEGGGGGGGVSARPVGVLEVSDAGTRFVRFGSRRRVVAAVVAGFVLGLLAGRRSGGK